MTFLKSKDLRMKSNRLNRVTVAGMAATSILFAATGVAVNNHVIPAATAESTNNTLPLTCAYDAGIGGKGTIKTSTAVTVDMPTSVAAGADIPVKLSMGDVVIELSALNLAKSVTAGNSTLRLAVSPNAELVSGPDNVSLSGGVLTVSNHLTAMKTGAKTGAVQAAPLSFVLKSTDGNTVTVGAPKNVTDMILKAKTGLVGTVDVNTKCTTAATSLNKTTIEAEEPSETEAPAPTETEAPAPTETKKPTETEAPAPTETKKPTPTETEKPTETAIPTESEAPAPTETEAPAPTETEKPTETAAPTETEAPAPTETEKPTETAIPTETEAPVPTETKKPTETATPTESEAPAPTETEKPTETAAPTETEAPAPTETEKPTETATPTETEAPAPTETPKPTEPSSSTDLNSDENVNGSEILGSGKDGFVSFVKKIFGVDESEEAKEVQKTFWMAFGISGVIAFLLSFALKFFR
ncbi:hypothetical protein ACEN19_05915 [Corynebacterium auriscanis]|uniref:hypothetical protein n=2 Tax=Corynebacterium auriscanis TaxID=99807 RepID=UPI003CF21498